MKRVEKVNIEVGTSIYTSYQRLKQTYSGVFKEFIDNSTQSYFDHRVELNNIGIKECFVDITITNDKIIILDNAYGMVKNDFERALKLNAPAPIYSDKSRSQFGMGLKYASVYLGDNIRIESTSLGSKDFYSATLDINELNKNIKYVDMEIDNIDDEIHYTKITIKQIRHKFSESDIDKLVFELGKIYQKDLKNGDLKIKLNNNEVIYREPQLWIDESGSEYWKLFDETFEFREKTYNLNGWIGILETADTSDNGYSGLSLLHNNRLIVTNYKREELLGKPNSFPYQRIIGEINMDDFEVDFNKSSFTWENGLEDYFINILKQNKIISEIINTSKKLRKKKQKKDKIILIDPLILNKKTETTFKNLSIDNEKTNSIKNENISSNIVVKSVDDTKSGNPISFKYDNKEYIFYIKYSDANTNKKWIKIEKNNESQYSYDLIINLNYRIFSNFNNNNIEGLVKITVAIALAQISSIKIGAESHKMTEIINDIINLLG